LASQFATEMAQHNIWGQMLLMEDRAEKMIDFFLAMATSYKMMASELSENTDGLRSALQKLRAAANEMDELRAKLKKQEAEQMTIVAELNSLKRRPGLTKQAGLMIPDRLKDILDNPTTLSRKSPASGILSRFRSSSRSSTPNPNANERVGNKSSGKSQATESSHSSPEPDTDTEAGDLEKRGSENKGKTYRKATREQSAFVDPGTL
jgi:hypothetical protein